MKCRKCEKNEVTGMGFYVGDFHFVQLCKDCYLEEYTPCIFEKCEHFDDNSEKCDYHKCKIGNKIYNCDLLIEKNKEKLKIKLTGEQRKQIAIGVLKEIGVIKIMKKPLGNITKVDMDKLMDFKNMICDGNCELLDIEIER